MSELEQLGERIAEQAAHLDAAMHRLLADLREFDARGGWHLQGAQSCAHWLAWRVGWGLVTARQHVRVAGKLADLPAINDALRRGEMSYSKVRAMVRVATPANEILLLEHARITTASQLEVLCRKYALVQRHGRDPHPLGDLQRRYVRRRDTEDGMVKIEAVLHPEEAELVWTMLNHAAAQLARESDSPGPDVVPGQCQGAEAPGAANAALAIRDVTMATRDVTIASRDVTMATHDATVAEALAADCTAQPSDTSGDALDDSAESASPSASPCPTAMISTAADPTSPATGSRADSLGDSAESGFPSACPAAMVNTAAGARALATGSRADSLGDSAESGGPSACPTAMVSTAAGARSLAIGTVPDALDDSAESGSPSVCPTAMVSTAADPTSPATGSRAASLDDSAESASPSVC